MMEGVFFLGITLNAWITIITVVVLLVMLIWTKIPTEAVFLGAMTVLMVSGSLSAEDTLSGFSNSSVVVIGALFVVVAGLVHTGVLQWITKYLMGLPKTYNRAIVRVMLPVACLSSVLSNTTVVALFVNVVKIWGNKLKISPSKLLIPLSYAAGMGGVITLIGTPPNMIIAGMYADKTGKAMNLFAPLWPGLFLLVVGIAATILLKKLLPNRKAPEKDFEATDEYTVEMLVPSTSELIGKTLEEAGLANVRGGTIIEIVRFDNEIIMPVSDDEFIMGGDRLIFAGQIDELIQIRNSHKLVSADHHIFSLEEVEKKRQFKTAYVTFGSDIIGKTWEQTGFAKSDNLTLVAVSRKGERIQQSPRDITLQAGDTLLMECPPKTKQLSRKAEQQMKFFDNQQLPNIGSKTLLSSLIMIAMVVVSTLEIMPLLQAAFAAALLMVIFKCCSVDQAMKSIDWNVLMVFVGSVVIGLAIEKSGLAQLMANGILQFCGTNPIVVMGAMSLAAMLLTNFISNTAAGAIFFPIVYNTAISIGYEPMPFLIALMLAVSSCYSTPIGSPTNLLVYAPGGYKFMDFVKIGIPMTIIMLAATLFIVNIVYPLTPIS